MSPQVIAKLTDTSSSSLFRYFAKQNEPLTSNAAVWMQKDHTIIEHY